VVTTGSVGREAAREAAHGAPALAMAQISKRFGANLVLDGVDFEVRAGEVHALLGENGAGKTTLMRIANGLETRDAGTISVRGVPVPMSSPAEAIARGVAMVHQHFMLVGNLTVAENVVLGTKGRHLHPFVSRSVVREVEAVAASYSIEIDARRRVDELSVDEQAKVEIVKALHRGADVLVLDEPTSSLGPRQIEELFAVVRTISAAGIAVVLVTHRLGEIKLVSERVTVLRDGKVADAGATADFTEAALARAMVGREVARARPAAPAPSLPAPEARLRVEDLVVRAGREAPALDGVSLAAPAGRVLGIVGVEGNGQTELLEVLAGLRRPSSGRVLLDGEDVTGLAPVERRRRGIVTISGDRHRWDIVQGLTIAENLALHDIAAGAFRGRSRLIAWREVRRHAERLVEEFDVRPRRADARIDQLSGGNQQKVVIARAVEGRPAVLVLGQPTRGLDIGAREFVHEQVLSARAAGTAVLLLSYDLEELFDLSDEIIVLFRGAISYRSSRAEARLEEVGEAMTGVVGARPAAAAAGRREVP